MLTFFFLMEFVLAFKSYLIVGAHQNENLAANEFRILTLGNSFTVGMGAPEGLSYPAQLEKILNSERAKSLKKIKVINKGINNVNSAQVLRLLDEFLVETQPQLVIIGVGQANSFNSYLYSDYLEREEELTSHKRLFYSLKNFLLHSRTINFFYLLSQPSYQKISSNADLKYDENYILLWSRYINDKMNRFKSWDQKKTKEEISYLEKINANKPTSSSYVWLGLIYHYALKDEQKAADVFMKGITVDSNSWYNEAYRCLKDLYDTTHQEKVKTAIQEFYNDLKKTDQQNAARLEINNQDAIGRWIKSDLKQMLLILEQKKIPAIIHNYQPGIPPALEDTYYSYYIREFANETQIPFFDVEKMLYAHFAKNPPEKYYAKLMGRYEGHLNEQGYSLVALGVASYIKSLNLISD